MNILFCDNPYDNKPTVDADYQDEFVSGKENGFTPQLFSYECLTKDNDAEFATRRIKHSDTLQKIIYRGWMLKPNQYALLYDELLTKNYKLINSPTEYQNCHYFPDSYKFISGHTPTTIWLTVENQKVNYDQVFADIAKFGNSPLIVKDYVKSQKHYWDAACYIPSAADKDKVKSIIEKFVELQNTDLNEGLVIREFVELKDLATHSKSGMPLKQEYRLFFMNGQLLSCYDYWEEGEYSADEHPHLNFSRTLQKELKVTFFLWTLLGQKMANGLLLN